VARSRRNTGILLIDTSKETHRRATLIRRFLSGMGKYPTPFRQISTLKEALSKLSPEERAAFMKMLQDRAAARGVELPRQVAPEPKDLGQVLTDLHVKPGQLRDILGP
jgi:hypothetical protein